VLSKDNFTSVKMPNASGFYDDDRETAEKAFWTKPCMTDCKADVKITGRARVIDVTPDDKAARRGAD
jgi:cytochrome c